MKLRLDKIDVTSKVDEFAQYLEAADRIILSAKFGDGKTYFLNELKKNKNLSEEYEFFTVYPVNYSVASNEDIFEYVKRDIIRQMYERKELDKFDVDAFFKAVKSFVDITSVVAFLLSFVHGGGLYNNILERFTRAKEEYDKQKHTADMYLSLFNNQRGGLYEDDGYTELIKETLRWVKENHGNEHKGKKTVLIIEDLDRLDPQHLFRIMNVLSAHIDDTSEPDKVSNKFGFDNIVMVMDYEATKHIFHHFYGKDANYEGYMSKFLDCEPFRYSLKDLYIDTFEKELSMKLEIPNIYYTMDVFRKKIRELPLRDIKKIAQMETSNFVMEDIFHANGINFSTQLPFFHLLIYMIHVGLNEYEISNSFNNTNDHKEYVKLLYPIFKIKVPNFHEYEYDGYAYSVNLLGGDVVKDVEIGQYMSYPSSKTTSLIRTNIEGEIRNGLIEGFGKCINTSSLMRFNQTSN